MLEKAGPDLWLVLKSIINESRSSLEDKLELIGIYLYHSTSDKRATFPCLSLAEIQKAIPECFT